MIDTFLEQFLKIIFSQNGLFCTLFLGLITFVLYTNNKRELRYQETIEQNQNIILKQAKNFDIVKEIKDDIDDLKLMMVSK